MIPKEKKDEFIHVSIELDKGKSDCEHDFLESFLLGVKRCQKCGRIEEYDR